MSRGRRSRDRGYISGNRTIAAPTYAEVLVNYLVVGGGGGGAVNSAGGGGAGGLRSTVTATGGGGTLETALTISTGTAFTVTVGAGGAGATGATSSGQTASGVVGQNSVFHNITSLGGGFGGAYTGNGGNGGSGGSKNGTGTANQGFNASTLDYGGGGGAGSIGLAPTGSLPTSGAGGSGGSGVAVSITGSSVTYAGGGGGAGDGRGTTGGVGGSGGGGSGSASSANGGNGTTNLGGGGGAAAFTSSTQGNGGAGGSGVVILRYSNLFALNVGAGLAYSTQAVSDDKVTTFTGGSGSVSFSLVPVTTGDYESIATVLVGSAGASSITFSNIPQTYKHLQIRFNYSTNNISDNTHIRFNDDTSANYSWHELYGQNGTNVLSGNYGGTLVTGAKFGYVGTTSAGFTGVGTSDILDYTNTNKIKVARHLVGTTTNSAVGTTSYILLRSVAWHNTSAITSITIYFTAGLITQNSHFALYGIKG